MPSVAGLLDEPPPNPGDRSPQKRPLMTSLPSSALTGFAIGVGLLTAIGAQNIALIRFSVNTRFGSTFAAVCLVSHCALLVAAISWPPSLLAPAVVRTASLAGALLLLLLGLRAAREAIVPAHYDPTTGPSASGRWEVISAALALSLANPHVYLDVVVVLGGLASSLPETPRYAFAVGNAAAAATWFFGVAFLAARMQNLLGRPSARRALSAVAAVSLLAASASFLVPLLH